jgi:hypothetical protein
MRTLPPSFGIFCRRAGNGAYVRLTSSSLICTRNASTPSASMAAKVTHLLREHRRFYARPTRWSVWRANYTPKLKKRTALLRKLKEVFRRYQSQPVDRVVQLINPMLRGWVNCFAVGHSSACFSFIKDWVEKKVRRHMLRAQKRKGFGWRRWSRPWLYDTLKLFNSYRVRRSGPKVAPAG